MFEIFQRLRWIYLSVFGIQVVPLSAIIFWRESVAGGHPTYYDTLLASVLKIDDVCYLAIITSVVFVDIGRNLVGILIEAPQDRAYKQGKAEERVRWLDYDLRMRNWHKRFLEAQERGEPFDEPAPESPAGNA